MSGLEFFDKNTKEGLQCRSEEGGGGDFKLVGFNQATGLVSPLLCQIYCLNPVRLGVLRSSASSTHVAEWKRRWHMVAGSLWPKWLSRDLDTCPNKFSIFDFRHNPCLSQASGPSSNQLIELLLALGDDESVMGFPIKTGIAHLAVHHTVTRIGPPEL